MTETEKPLLYALFSKMGIAGMKKDDDQAKKHFEEARRPLEVLNAHLAKHEYLLGGRFTVADLNVASVLNWARASRFSLAEWPKVDAWLTRCSERPAAVKARG